MLASLSDEEWASPSRCAGWSAQDVAAHLVGVDAFWAASVLAALAGAPTRVLAAFDPAATPPAMVSAMTSLSSEAVLAQFVESTERFLGVLSNLDESGWAALAEVPPGHVPVRLLAHHALWDAWVHERDMVVPLGREAVAVDDEVRSCLRYSAAVSPAIGFGFGAPPRGTYAIEAADPSTSFVLTVDEASVRLHEGVDHEAPCWRGDAVSMIEALSIRAPFPSTAPPEWRLLLDGLSTAFDAPSA